MDVTNVWKTTCEKSSYYLILHSRASFRGSKVRISQLVLFLFPRNSIPGFRCWKRGEEPVFMFFCTFISNCIFYRLQLEINQFRNKSSRSSSSGRFCMDHLKRHYRITKKSIKSTCVKKEPVHYSGIKENRILTWSLVEFPPSTKKGKCDNISTCWAYWLLQLSLPAKLPQKNQKSGKETSEKVFISSLFLRGF